MNTATKLTMTLAITAVGAFANDQLIGIRDHARDLEREFRGIHEVVKDKKFNVADLQSRVEWTAGHVEKLKTLVAEFETANPNAATNQDWKQAKDFVTLIDMFHAQKAQIVTEGGKNRSMLKVHALGLAKRAAMLQQSADRALKSLGS